MRTRNIQQLNTDSIWLAVTVAQQLDALRGATDTCEREVIEGGATNVATSAAKTALGKALAELAHQFLEANNVDTSVLPAAVSAAVVPRSSLATEVEQQVGHTDVPQARMRAVSEAGAPSPTMTCAGPTPPASASKRPSKSPRLATTFSERNGRDSHPCTSNHFHRRPHVGDKVKLRGVPGVMGKVKGVVTSVTVGCATVHLDDDSAHGSVARDHTVNHCDILHVSDTKRCTSNCHTKLDTVPQIGDTATIIDTNDVVVGVLVCDGLNNRLHLKPNGQCALIGWAWV